MILDDKLAAGEVIVLDGATGTEIARLGGEMDGVAWCALANKTHPDEVRGVHESYLRAGADVIITNTFATCRHVLEGVGLGDETIAINRRAVELAREARENVGPDRPVAVAGSISNMLAWHRGTIGADPRYRPTPEKETANYREMADLLAESGCDLLVMEMMMDVERAMRAIEPAIATGLPVWIGISASRAPDDSMVARELAIEQPGKGYESNLRPLEPILDALTALGAQVTGIMHSSIDATTPGLEMLFERWAGPVMVYPETIRTDASGDASVSPEVFAAHCRGWVEDGVQIIGGCCGTTIKHIRAMVDGLPARPGRRPQAEPTGRKPIFS